ncbi:hypothetical protein MKL09_09805 [Methylobacterium sp. J-048]|uniref:hypothetical protein n=1 Tax=Methylobacterium sp. J-048 TaxID=2836635 RepID=UPI001FBA7516|nr:hypothetical protein [Methylobacterium sp. J-048]MCJ2056848.1 hypothetical protein [Methylobacterium sp. J-048]
MPERMKFCASMSKCSQAYTVGKPGTVRIAKDRAPLDEEKLNKLMSFLADKLSPGDFDQFQDLIDDVVDDAEETNPSEQMAQDGYSKSTRRTIRRAHRNIALGFDSRPAGLPGAAPRIAHDAAGFASRFPDATRIKSDPTPAVHHGYTQSKPRLAMDAAQSKSLDERFGTGRIGHAS